MTWSDGFCVCINIYLSLLLQSGVPAVHYCSLAVPAELLWVVLLFGAIP